MSFTSRIARQLGLSRVALDTPLNSCFDYRWPCAPGEEPQIGQLVLVPTNGREGRLLGFRPGQDEPIVDVRADSALRTAPRVVGETVIAQAADGRVLAWSIKRTSR